MARNDPWPCAEGRTLNTALRCIVSYVVDLRARRTGTLRYAAPLRELADQFSRVTSSLLKHKEGREGGENTAGLSIRKHMRKQHCRKFWPLKKFKIVLSRAKSNALLRTVLTFLSGQNMLKMARTVSEPLKMHWMKNILDEFRLTQQWVWHAQQ